ncbi:MAG TPA: hypothetical protein PL045_02150, partial [Chitinophagaceae bacterium]|nr:hypothetical protein [Chitinophagaceae bacterium]
LNNPAPTGVKYFLVFRYNSNVFVAPGSGLIGQPNPQQAFTLFTDPQNYPQGIPIQFVRTYHGETAPSSAFITGITNFLGSNSNYTNGVVAKLNTNPSSPLNSVSFTENNWFISLITKNPLANGNTTAVDAQLIQYTDSTSTYSTLADYPIEGMGVVFAHDPNYITQSPVCMQLPKIVRDMKYHIHFQNTGRGPADTVKITANLPFGLDLATCQLDRVVYSGYNYAIGINNDHNELDTTLDQLRNKIIFTLYKTSSNINSNISNNNLEGTDNVYNPAVNPETMGDIYFTVSATVNVPYSLPAQATIEFHSGSSLPGLWENPVATNIAVSNYSNCCNCNLFDCDKNEKGNGPKIKKAAVKKIKPD